LDLDDPAKIVYRIHDTIIETKTIYEKEGIVSNVIFPCGVVVIKNELFVYYGAADKVVAAATVSLKDLMQAFLREAKQKSGFVTK
jgi:predicted GH43/DUF377 family glycosyl hydrolase